jgi:hypothetical protein
MNLVIEDTPFSFLLLAIPVPRMPGWGGRHILFKDNKLTRRADPAGDARLQKFE